MCDVLPEPSGPSRVMNMRQVYREISEQIDQEKFESASHQKHNVILLKDTASGRCERPLRQAQGKLRERHLPRAWRHGATGENPAAVRRRPFVARGATQGDIS